MKTPIFQNSIALTAFFQICNFRNVNFTDAVVSGYVFKSAKGLTFEQIKSTWNYKTGNMGEIVLPEDIQKEFGKEQFFASKSFKEKRLLAEENPVISPEHADYELFFPINMSKTGT